MEIERNTTTQLPLNLYLFSDSPKELKKKTKNPFVRNTIEIWFKAQNYLGIDQKLSFFTPIWENMEFIPGNKDPGFKKWADRGITKISDLYDDSTIISFEALKNRHDIPLKHFFKYLQLRSYIAQSQNQFDELFKKGSKEKHLLSQLYDSLLPSTSPSMQGIKAGWEQELDTEIDRDLWDKIT